MAAPRGTESSRESPQLCIAAGAEGNRHQFSKFPSDSDSELSKGLRSTEY